MESERSENEMIEIGDPNIEPLEADPPARVVIEYRDRGVPWMLIPPMLVIAGLVAVLAHSKLRPPPQPPRVESPRPVAAAEPAVVPSTIPVAVPVVTEPAAVVQAPVQVPVQKSVADVPVEEAANPSVVASAVEPTKPEPLAPSPFDPTPAIKVEGLGFDPKALERASRDPEPPVDAGLAPAAAPQEARDQQPARADVPAMDPDGRELPREVDPDDLPVDPREAKLRRERRAVEARRKAEADRGQFHAELRAICRQMGERGVPQMEALCLRYGVDVDPTIKSRATNLLSRSAAGAGRATRINLLRNLGYPEPAILNDVFEDTIRWDKGSERGGAQSKDQAMYRSAVLLLSYPPNRVATPTRPVSSTTRPGQ